jgi:lipid-A-disaccharide synthase
MGLFEVLGHLPRLMRIRRDLQARVLADPPDVFIGIDYQEFNLSVAARLKAAGIRTVQYVSPQVWAWRQGRVRTIGRAVDLILCLLPFEAQFYAAHAVKASFVGHPLADQIPFELDPLEARRALGLDTAGQYIALLPGSRHGEVSRLAPDFAATVAWLKERRPEVRFIAAAANAGVRRELVAALEKAHVSQHVTVIDGHSQRVLAASDAVLLASGTATLETSLVKRPMVVVYRLSALTTAIVKRFNLIKSQFIAQPNLLAGRAIVPEFVNEQVRADLLGPALIEQLERPDRAELLATFGEIHRTLKRDASAQAAAAILELLESPAAGVGGSAVPRTAQR